MLPIFANGAATGAFAAAVSAAVQRDGSGQFTDEDRQAAKAAADVYNDDTGGLLGELGIDYDPKDGFAASLTVDEDGKYTLTYRGTEGEGDWPANIRQALGKETSQYKQAISLARQVHRATDGNVLFVGHSLGGGLASAAAVATGSRAITFNAAGLHPNTISGTHGGIRAHYIRGDILSTLQDWTPFTPNAMGTRISHSGRGHPLARHSMSQFSGK